MRGLEKLVPVSIAAAIFFGTSANALDRLELIGGSTIVGTIVERSEDLVRIRLNDGPLVEVRVDQIARIEDLFSTLRFAGSNTIGERLVPELIEGYVEARGGAPSQWIIGPEINEKALQVGRRAGLPEAFDVRAHGSSTAYPALAGKEADIGMSSRPIEDDEVSLLATLGNMRSADSEHILALDGLAIIVHPDNPIDVLDKAAIAELFACEKTDWGELGGADGPVRLYARDAKSGTYDTFESLVLEPLGLELCDTARRVESSTSLADSVAKDPNAIGFIGLGYVRNAKPLAVVECNWAYAPSTFNVQTEEYPLARRLFLYAPLMQSSPFARDFVDFALSDEGQRRVRDVGFVDLAIAEAATDTYRLEMVKAASLTTQRPEVARRLIEETSEASRLSATFRFRQDVGDLEQDDALDNRALRDLMRLAPYLAEQTAKGAEFMVLGYADAAGDYDYNLALSERRAQTIAGKLASLGAEATLVEGFGEEAPTACNNAAPGRAKNRRVEVWLRPGSASGLDERLRDMPM